MQRRWIEGKSKITCERQRFYRKIGRLGGSAETSEPKGFACNPERARIAGAKGGKISKRGKAKHAES